MIRDFALPDLGEGLTESEIVAWRVEVGDHVELNQIIADVETAKAVVELPSPFAGTVTALHAAEGETVNVGEKLFSCDTGEGSEADAAAPAEADAGEPVAAETNAGDVPVAAGAAAPAGGAAPTAPVPDRGPRSQILSPLVRRLAQEHGIDLSTVAGTGTGGRITKQDVMAVVASGGGGAAASPAASSSAPAPEPVAAPPSVGAAAAQGETVEPMSHIRKAIASHMLASVNETARAWTMVEVNVDHLVKLRERTKDAFLAAHGVKLTYLPFVVRATVDALAAHPPVNSRIVGDDIVTPRAVHMGIAVSSDAGLIVPVIHNADVMNSVGIARAIADLAARARSRQLQPDEVQGATFTITNPGPYGSLISVPIINQPNVGILSLDGIQRRPVVLEGDAIAVRSMVYISMSWDHRLIDGEIATRFLGRVKHNLETWDFAEDLGV
jgi:2-oxoglutarate dehydrogenase dihydrolipoamide succinyltransferase (E2 component)